MISVLEKQLRQSTEASLSLPTMTDSALHMLPRPMVLLQGRRRHPQQEVLVHCEGLPQAKATWVLLENLKTFGINASFLEDKETL